MYSKLAILSFIASIVCTNGGVLDSVYGPPIKKPFEKYGPPEEGLIRSPIIEIPKPVEDSLLLPAHRTPITEAEVVIPPNTQIHITDERNQYSSGFQSPEGTEVLEQGRLITTNGGWEYVIAKTGSYKYISPEGKEVNVEWIADENGFRILSSNV